MGFPSSLTDVANKVSDILGKGPDAPGAAAAAPMVQADAVYTYAGDIDDAGQNKPGATALNHDNIYDPKLPIHFVHFGYFHTDGYDNFHHAATLSDNKPDVLPDGNTNNRGIMFRAALAREAILINSFISCAASIAQEMTASSAKSSGPAGLMNGVSSLAGPTGGMGAIQNAAGAVSGLLGGNSGTSAAPDASALKPYQSGVQAAGAKINVSPLPYVDMHQAGLDLHQCWLNFDKFVPSMAAPTTNKPGSGLLGNVGGTLSSFGVPSLGAAGDVIGILTGILFSMPNIYQGMYLNLRIALEPVIREQCYQRSLAAIRASDQPIFDVWSVPPDQSTPLPKASPNQKEKVMNASTGTAADGYMERVNKPYDDGLNKIDSASGMLADAADSWDSFWQDPAPKEGKGKPQLDAIRAAYADPTAPILAGFVSGLSGISKTINQSTFPLTVVNKILSIIAPACCEMLGDIFEQLQDPAFVKGGITGDSFNAAGRIYIRTKLEGLILGSGILDSILAPLNSALTGAQNGVGSAFSGAKGVGQDALGSVPGMGRAFDLAKLPSKNLDPLQSKTVADKALSLADGLAGKNLDPIMDFAMGSLHKDFTDTLAMADQNSLVMEVFLGQLPYLITSLVRNIFFPFFQMLVEKALGPLGAAANLASSPVNDLMSSGRDKDRDAKQTIAGVNKKEKDAAGFAKQWLGHGYTVQGQDVDNPLGDTVNDAADKANDLTDKYLGAGGDGGGASAGGPAAGGAGFPGSARKTTCFVNPVTKGDYDQVDAIDNQLLIDHKLKGGQ